MIRDAMEKVIDLTLAGADIVRTTDGSEYSRAPMYLLPEERKAPLANALTLHSLQGLVDLIDAQGDTMGERLMLHVVSPGKVDLLGHLDEHRRNEYFGTALADDLVAPFLSRFQCQEDFVIWLQTAFASGGDREDLLKLVGNIVDESISTSTDDGVTQTVAAKKGVALRGDAELPNPVRLLPRRSFPEIEPQEALFVLRAQKGNGDLPKLALFEADGGAWQIGLRRSIHAFLAATFKADEDRDRVSVLA